MEYYCYRCKRTSFEAGILVTVHAPGMYFICNDCIKDIEKEENKIALYHPLKGVNWFDKEKADELLEGTTDD